MSEYMPRVGDKVRATLGESTNFGEVVDRTANNGNCVQIELSVESWAFCDISDGWKFEQVVTVPSKFGAVIRRADGQLFVLAAPDDPGEEWVHPEGGWWSAGDATAVGFTVLFDGVGE